MKTKKDARLRRAARTRRSIKQQDIHRLCVNRSNQHIYAQLIASDGAKVLASASTLDEELRAKDLGAGIKAAEAVGNRIAERVLALGIKKVAFDRSGYLYHGRVKALAESARKNGLEF